MPSELQRLTWDDIDWDKNLIHVHFPKLEHTRKARRVVPLFRELRPHLELIEQRAESGAVHVIPRAQNRNVNLRTQFEKIVTRAGQIPWPRLFQNLRATRETELAREHPLHVVTAWIGNSAKIAEAHYLQVTEEDVLRAVRIGNADSDAHMTQNPTQHASAPLLHC